MNGRSDMGQLEEEVSLLKATVAELSHILAQEKLKSDSLRHQLEAMRSSRSWKCTAPLRRVAVISGALRKGFSTITRWAQRILIRSFAKDPFIFKIFSKLRLTRGFEPYELWQIRFAPSEKDLQEQASVSATMKNPVVFSIILPVYKTHIPWLRETIESVRKQSYPFWELCIVDDHSECPGIRSLLSTYAFEDSRIKYTSLPTHGHIARASNAAIALSTGTYIIPLDHDDLLSPHALFSLAQALQHAPQSDFLYSDNDKLTPQGHRAEPTCKPQWSPEYFLSVMYTCHLSAFRRSLVIAAGGYREGFEGSQDYDLVLRITERTKNILHIPDILYHWRAHADSVAGNPDSKPYAYTAAKRSLLEALQRRGFLKASVAESRWKGFYKITYNTQLKDRPFIISYHAPIEASADLSTHSEADAVQQFREIATSCGHNKLILCTHGAAPTFDAIEALLDHLENPEISCAAPLLLDASSCCLAAGYSFLAGNILPNLKGAPASIPGYKGRLAIPFNVSLLGASCVVLRSDQVASTKGDYESFQGFLYALCLASGQQGFRAVIDPTVKVKISSAETTIPPKDYVQIANLHSLSSPDPYLPLGLINLPSKGFPYE